MKFDLHVFVLSAKYFGGFVLVLIRDLILCSIFETRQQTRL